MKRLFFFCLVNIAIIVVLGTIMTVFNVQPYLTDQGLNLTSLLIFAAVIGFTGSFISLFLSKWMVKWTMKVKLIKSPQSHQESKLVEIISRIAAQLGINTPEIGIYPSGEVNAFATGWGKNHSLVAVSAGLLDAMNEDELEGVLAHEMAHISNGDMVTMVLIQGVINTFIIFAARVAAFAVQKFLGKDNEAIGGLSYWLTSIAFEIVFGILASTIVFWFSRRREFRADLGGAKFVGKNKMIAALKKLETLHGKIDTRQKSMATMKISDKPRRLLFASHPPLADRIKALQQAQI